MAKKMTNKNSESLKPEEIAPMVMESTALKNGDNELNKVNGIISQYMAKNPGIPKYIYQRALTIAKENTPTFKTPGGIVSGEINEAYLEEALDSLINTYKTFSLPVSTEYDLLPPLTTGEPN